MPSTVLDRRSAGVLLHPTSLPGPLPSGDLGPRAHEFLTFLRDAGIGIWQMLPIHPVGAGYSPYDSPSAFAGAPHLISLEGLVEDGLLSNTEIASSYLGDLHTSEPERRADLSRAYHAREPWLRRAYARRAEMPQELRRHEEEFFERERPWLWDFALFCALKDQQDGRSWLEFEPDIRRRETSALQRAHRALSEEVHYRAFEQFCFDRQWRRLKSHATELGISLMGDIPMFVAHDSADVWCNQHMFFLDEKGERLVQAGVPPDYFSEDGQLWGNPLYRWDRLEADGFGWWVDRLRRELRRFDVIRIDHFIALRRYWEVPVPAETAKHGRYVEVPGAQFLERVRSELGGLPLIAEDLGIVTEDVERLRDHFGLPGMKVLQFAFSPGAEAYLPYRHPARSVVYTGTHDNDTTLGYIEGLVGRLEPTGKGAPAALVELERVISWAGTADPRAAADRLMRILFASPSNTAIVPVQDVLGLDTRFRMNVPGIANGNWSFRLAPSDLSPRIAENLRALCEATGRCSYVPKHL